MDGGVCNGSTTRQALADGNQASGRITNVIVNGRPVSDGVRDQGLFGYHSLRTVVSNWLNKQNIGSFRIENNMARGASSAGCCFKCKVERFYPLRSEGLALIGSCCQTIAIASTYELNRYSSAFAYRYARTLNSSPANAPTCLIIVHTGKRKCVMGATTASR